MYLPERIKQTVNRLPRERAQELEELRIRAGLPLMAVFRDGDWFIEEGGHLTRTFSRGIKISGDELKELFYQMCEHSIYAYQDEIQRGFITLKGGHRAGICGTVVYDGDRIKGMRDISSVCIRMSRQITGCAEKVFRAVQRGNSDIYNTLILSPPRCGKTTLLRDLCRLVSKGSEGGFTGLRTAVVDERSELAASYRGLPQNDLGPRTDVLDGCRKSEGIELMLRSMAPDVILVDELGSQKDAESIKNAWNAGVRIVATAHAYGLEDFKKRWGMGGLADENGFERYIILGIDNGKRWVRVMDKDGREHNFADEANRRTDDFYRLHSHRS